MNCSDESTLHDLKLAKVTGELSIKLSEGGIVRKTLILHDEAAERAAELMREDA